MNNDLPKLVEAVRAAHADIAPTYAEYVQLAFAIATDCGEAGRSDFISLCEPSPKFNALHANKLFSSALRTGNQNVHLGTAFHLAKLAGVEIGFKFQGFTKPFSSHTRVSTYNTADTEIKPTRPAIGKPRQTTPHSTSAASLTPPCHGWYPAIHGPRCYGTSSVSPIMPNSEISFCSRLSPP